jgi:hypothetical protein
MSMPPGQPAGSGGQQYGPPSQDLPTAIKRRWPRRHPVWSAVIAIVVLLIIIGATTNKPTKVSNTATDTVPRPTATPMAHSTPLECRAQAASKRPRDHTTVTVKVHTVARAEVTATSRGASLKNKNLTGSSNANGNWTLRLRVGNATPGTRVVVTVHVSRHGGTGSCQASFRSRASAAAVSATGAPATQPAASPSSAPVATQPAASPTTAASCYPLSDEGTCYEPGEYCRDDDHGVSGVAGDGENIVCEDNDGWRWEPA